MSELFELQARATCLLAAGFLATAALRRASAGTRHAVWAAAPAAGIGGVAVPPIPMLSAVYLAGVAGVLLHLAAGLARVRRLTRSARPVGRDSGWRRILDELEALRPPQRRRSIEILVSPSVPVPFTWGALRPVAILSPDAESWPPELKRQALRHELAHVERWDWLTQTFGRLVCAVYWFHPLVWIAGRRLALEAERASDDHVLLTGASSSDYAEHLVALARRLRTRPLRPLSAVTMAGRSQLPGRIQTILDTRTRRSDMTRLSPRILPILTLTLLLASAQLVPAGTAALDEPPVDPLARYLIEAVNDGDEAAALALLEAGARADVAVPGDGNALIAAAGTGDVDLLQRLIATGADVNSAVEGDGCPLIAAAREGHLDAARLLVESGADVDQVVPGDENPLIQAAWNGHLEVVRYLIDQGADVGARVWANGREWRSPLRQARLGGHRDVVELLLAAGAAD